jgi:hypothetical protein
MKWREHLQSVMIIVVGLGLMQAAHFCLAAQGQEFNIGKNSTTDNNSGMSKEYTKTAHAFIDCMAKNQCRI